MPYVSEMGVTNIQLYGVFGSPTTLDGCIALHSKFIRDWVEAQDTDEDSESTAIHMNVQEWLSKTGFAVFNSESTCDELRDLQNQMAGIDGLDAYR